jgi:competence ComEA-like helix-hairpin-helix protein
MSDFTPEERRVAVFLLAVAFCGLTLNILAKFNSGVKKMICPPMQLSRIDLNKISLEELIEVRCMPENLVQGILSYRRQHGDFRSLEQLKEVRGIGERRYERLKEIFFVE